MNISYLRTYNDEELEGFGLDQLKQLYIQLRDHHIDETTKLWAECKKLKAVGPALHINGHTFELLPFLEDLRDAWLDYQNRDTYSSRIRAENAAKRLIDLASNREPRPWGYEDLLPAGHPLLKVEK